jgi:hypothetical protein
MSSTAVADLIVLVLVSAAAFSTGWVLRDAQARGLPRRKALTWAALQWIEFPLFLWLYRRIRPKGRRAALGLRVVGPPGGHGAGHRRRSAPAAPRPQGRTQGDEHDGDRAPAEIIPAAARRPSTSSDLRRRPTGDPHRGAATNEEEP